MEEFAAKLKLALSCPVCQRVYESGECISCPKDGAKLGICYTDPLVGQVVLQKYKILSVIGTGGWGVVYKAKHEKLGKIVALKVLHSHLLDLDAVARFEQEATTASRLNHPNICAVQDLGVLETGQPYLVLEYVEGITLKSLVAIESRIDAARALLLFKGICVALEHAHQRGIVHRDIKPSNILITTDGGTDHVVVLDFGLAKFVTDAGMNTLTKTGETLGTPAYMSPEQCRALPIDGRADLYSLGCVMYECLTGAPPFEADSMYEQMMHHLNSIPEPINASCPQARVPEGLEDVILRSLEKDPQKRFQTAAQMAAALDSVKVDQPARRYGRQHLKPFKPLLRNVIKAAQSRILQGVLIAIACGALVTFGLQLYLDSKFDFDKTWAQYQTAKADGDPKSEFRALRKLARLAPGDRRWLDEINASAPSSQFNRHALAMLQIAIESDLKKFPPEPQSSTWVNYGEALRKAQDYDKAEEAYNRVVALNASDEHVYAALLGLAGSAVARRNWEKAGSYYDKALARTIGNKPWHAATKTAYANAVFQQRDFAKAERLYLDALDEWKNGFGSHSPFTAYGSTMLGSFYISTGKLAAAEQCLTTSKKIVQKAPHSHSREVERVRLLGAYAELYSKQQRPELMNRVQKDLAAPVAKP